MPRKSNLNFLANPTDAYLDEVRKARTPLSLQDEQALAIRIRQGDKEALHTLVEANLRFVVAVCRNYQNQGLPLGDLISEGNLGLIRAAQRFDGSLNVKFISYAVWWIRQTILAALAEQSRVMNIPPGRITTLQRIGKAGRSLEQRLGRPAGIQELSEELQMEVRELTECLQLGTMSISLDTPVSQDGDASLSDTLSDPESPLPDESALRSLLRKNMQELMADLEEREREVLTLYFGLGNAPGINLEEIAAQWGVTRERVRQIKDQAIRRLRHPSRIGRLKPFQE